ncbi:Long-chain base-1-phosphate phosphatase [Cystobasidiomycetes sp. EMM_F5]
MTAAAQTDSPAGLARFDLPRPGATGYPASIPSWARPTSSASSSRAVSPAPSTSSRKQRNNLPNLSIGGHDGPTQVLALSAGCQPDEVYKNYMGGWRYRLRRALVKNLEWESPIMAKYQVIRHLSKAARRPYLDTYFVWSSILGTQYVVVLPIISFASGFNIRTQFIDNSSAFMIGLPLFWWFGNAQDGRALLNVLSAGVYLASVFKDLFCVPRPYTPPVERLSISSHGLEYGFPSTHSTNAVSISLLFANVFLRAYPNAPAWATGAVLCLCGAYAISVVTGRLYCGMHSLMDCVAGSLLGTAIFVAYIRLEPLLEDFLLQPGYIVPSLILPTLFLLVSTHPQPVDDCPCFEDAIAFVSVAAGISLGWWSLNSHPALQMSLSLTTRGAMVDSDVLDKIIRLSSILAKLSIGVGAIFVWRIIAKRAMYFILPPLFHIVTPIIELPRRFYRPARNYQQIEISKPLQAIPSVLNLADLGSPSIEMTNKYSQGLLFPPTPVTPSSASSLSPSPSPTELSAKSSSGSHKQSEYLQIMGTASRRPKRSTEKQHPSRQASGDSQNSDAADASSSKADRMNVRQVRVVHFDVDVITKVVVYSGIGFIATLGMPLTFMWMHLDV